MDMKNRQPSQRSATTPLYPSLSPACIPLGPCLWFNPNVCILLREGVGEIALTARECELLTIFLAHPRCYLSADFLADRLTHANAPVPIHTHTVEQAICTLRSKLGEDGKNPSLLRTLRRRGYGLFPQAKKPHR
jgi:DNA-binding response OmpR family regulator